MKTLSLVAVAITTLTLVACTEGGDVYVTGSDPSPTSSSTALECTITPGANVCNRDMESVAQADRRRTLDVLQAVSDFAGVTELAMNDLEGACRGIVTETSGTLPTLPSTSTPEERVDVLCHAAHDAIVASEPGALRVGVAPVHCTDVAPQPCTAPSAVLAPACAPPIVTVSTADGASAVATAVGEALSHHYAALVAVKGRFNALASTSARITANAEALTLLPAPCIVTSTKLLADALKRIQAAIDAAGLVAGATGQVSQ